MTASPPPSYSTAKKSQWPLVIGAMVIVFAICSCIGLGIGIYGSADDTAAVTPGGTVAQASAGQPEDPSPRVPTEFKVGEVAKVTIGDTEVHYQVASTTTAKSDEFGIAPSKGVYLGAEVKVSVITGEATAVGLDWAMVTADGTVVQQELVSLKGKELFSGGTLTSGQKADGWITFNVTEAALKGAKLQLTILSFASLTGENQQVYWTL